MVLGSFIILLDMIPRTYLNNSQFIGFRYYSSSLVWMGHFSSQMYLPYSLLKCWKVSIWEFGSSWIITLFISSRRKYWCTIQKSRRSELNHLLKRKSFVDATLLSFLFRVGFPWHVKMVTYPINKLHRHWMYYLPKIYWFHYWIKILPISWFNVSLPRCFRKSPLKSCGNPLTNISKYHVYI